MNAINLIVPYRYEGMWVFDDAMVSIYDLGFRGPSASKVAKKDKPFTAGFRIPCSSKQVLRDFQRRPCRFSRNRVLSRAPSPLCAPLAQSDARPDRHVPRNRPFVL
jgi:hypothetical protein